MLGSKRQCSNCNATSFRRVKVNRTIQCQSCQLVLEERCINDLKEYHAVTQTEEVHCVVTPDHLHNYLVDDIPNDPYCTPGFITGFRMLSPLREPVYAATARTLSGSLAEMERLIGDSLFAGYVGYNGRAPGGAPKKEDIVDPAERNKSGGDARHTLVAYFEIVELASILCVDRETANLAIRIFRHTANNTSLRNRNVESLATAAFVSATERRWQEYQEWLKKRDLETDGEQPSQGDDASDAEGKEKELKDWPNPLRQISVEEIAVAANLDVSEVGKYLKVVNVALRKQRPENSSSITTHMPMFCRRLELPAKTRRLAIGIAEKAMENNICSRRNPISISAAAIYLACQLDGIRKTQTEICRATTLTEVTLRKVYKELNSQQSALLPDWYQNEEEKQTEQFPRDTERPFARFAPGRGGNSNAKRKVVTDGVDGQEKNDDVADAPSKSLPLEPPPLPPGFAEAGTNVEDQEKAVNVGAAPPAPVPPPLPSSEAIYTPSASNVIQAFANVFSMMPQFMPPPPPPLPIPTSGDKTSQGKSKQTDGEVAKDGKDAASSRDDESRLSSNPVSTITANGVKTEDGNAVTPPQSSNDKDAITKATPSSLQTSPPLSQSQLPPQPGFTQGSPQRIANPVDLQAAAGGMMMNMQTMVNMMQAMQAFQAMQQQATNEQKRGSMTEQMNPFAMMAMAMAQTQNQNQTQRVEVVQNGQLNQKPVETPQPASKETAGSTADDVNDGEKANSQKKNEAVSSEQGQPSQ